MVPSFIQRGGLGKHWCVVRGAEPRKGNSTQVLTHPGTAWTLCLANTPSNVARIVAPSNELLFRSLGIALFLVHRIPLGEGTKYVNATLNRSEKEERNVISRPRTIVPFVPLVRKTTDPVTHDAAPEATMTEMYIAGDVARPRQRTRKCRSRWHKAGRPRSVILWSHLNDCGTICRIGHNRHKSEGECFP